MDRHDPGWTGDSKNTSEAGVAGVRIINPVDKIIRGSHLRKTRFHDEKGNVVDLAGAFLGAVSLFSAVLRVTTGYRPQMPTISFRATRAISSLIEKDWKIAEFGSGMSTPWLGRRCGFLLSIESDEHWYRKVREMLREGSLDHVRYELREPARYCDLSGDSDGYFDFALIDGLDRAGCVRSVAPKIRRGGWIYLDNSDKDMTRPGGDLRRAEEGLLREIEERGGSVRYFVDFSPTNFFVEQGMLARL